ncbi:uncharacterized protein BDR25DRAFT_354483 [Lindgomyces ingoldianus]|uniref:Uncharacterized protein n=1 Tax=Lindgomyces ingoldianus TaxID=673940 RepID=A0ACB6QWN6_9PLEO|nr:uncharacterized protein BDR25DRAFT_354483 [Lindgomyces ingoldianus]KAF2471227.1 hypothetical protein BDR25DRAFT_354483 [Lindgomyces ingoldianus]
MRAQATNKRWLSLIQREAATPLWQVIRRDQTTHIPFEHSFGERTIHHGLRGSMLRIFFQ